jgi:DNA-binding MarR family transcriptional regulator
MERAPGGNTDTGHGAGILRRLEELLAAYQAMRDALWEVAGVTGREHSILAALATAPDGASGGSIARACGVSRQAAHVVLDDLEGAHLVEGNLSGGARPVHGRYFLSEWGASRVAFCSTALETVQEELARQFSAEEIETLCQLLGACARGLRHAAQQTD